MRDLNSVLIEGIVTAIKPKRDRSGVWAELRNRQPKGADLEGTSHRFRVELNNNLHGCPPDLFTIGRRIRVVGHLRRQSRLGSFIAAEFVEVKGLVGASV